MSPLELSEIGKTRSGQEDTEDAFGQEGDSANIMSKAASLLLASGYEPAYKHKYWSKDSNIRRANCYAYAMDVLKRTEGKLRPGSLSGKTYKSLTKSSIMFAVDPNDSFLGSGRLIKKQSVHKNKRKN